jgi:hypothetical protein
MIANILWHGNRVFGQACRYAIRQTSTRRPSVFMLPRRWIPASAGVMKNEIAFS